jgi:hypothetical protein
MMDSDDENLYTEFDPIIIGGPTNDYSIIAPMVSSRWVQFAILSICTGDPAGATGVVVSGNSKPVQPNYVGAAGTALDTDHVMHGQAFRILASTTVTPAPLQWIRVTNSEKKVFVRIDAQASSSAYVTLQFRARRLTIVPGPSHEVHPDHMHTLNQARSEMTVERLKEMGVPGYAEEGTGVNTNKGY